MAGTGHGGNGVVLSASISAAGVVPAHGSRHGAAGPRGDLLPPELAGAMIGP
jgi:hypothetical protein